MSSENPSEKKDHHRLITQDHVKAALQADKGDEAELLSWTINDFLKVGDNFGSVVTSVRISFRLGHENQSVSYIVKANPGQAYEDYREIMDSQFVKEGEFYERILPALNAELKAINQEPLRCPRGVYYSSGIGNDLIFLEDLRHRGFKMQGNKDGLDVPHALLAFKELARLHAASVLLRGKCKNEDLSAEYKSLKQDLHNCSEKAGNVLTKLLSKTFEDVVRILQKIDGYEVVKKWLTDNKTKTLDIFERQIDGHPPFEVLCHGDCWHNNFLFRYDNEGAPAEVVMIDLPQNRTASLATDLNFMMYLGISSDIRKTYKDDFIASYYSAFDDVMKGCGRAMPFSHKDLLQEYKKRLEYGLLFGLFGTMLLARAAEDAPDFTAVSNEEEFLKVSAISEKTLNTMSKDPRFWPRLLGILDEMVEYGVIS